MLKDLPAPPAGKKGWPWTKESKSLPPLMPDGKKWPKISIVTPSYNQGQFLEETIRSVLLQNYPNLEYVIMDGGSADNSVEIIKKYEKHLSYWISEKDKGQTDAIQRAFEKATGEIIGWINSDDYFMPNALSTVAKEFSKQPDIELLIGGYLVIRASGKKICKYYSFPQSFESLLCAGQLFGQMASFWKRDVFFSVGGLDCTLRFCFDYDLFLRLILKKNPHGINKILAAYRLHQSSKSSLIWEKVGNKEKIDLQVKCGIQAITERDRATIISETQKKFTKLNLIGLLSDFLFDPIFLLKSSASRIRDNIFNPILKIISFNNAKK
jgi:glycosyltransferase involved in cell wall biosynthesis